ncbi:GntR family transcriptional regulator [Paenibacillus sp. DMB20]|uniref:GntR family transcriptional regulator n=1 Tax=Paenibacillus sp. DMB20 TaxID=1642570 RepID=UPI0006277A42|nr:GntR family transcriptional regulator [Paenibacillus sp. DMB20]KKO54064.1 hypothetical protein XI25_08165 [Paenibacillus sp. DMB20]
MNKVAQSTYQIQRDVDRPAGQIVRGVYKPGEYLPSETDLAKVFMLSKNSVRLVLDKLVKRELSKKYRAWAIW